MRNRISDLMPTAAEIAAIREQERQRRLERMCRSLEDKMEKLAPRPITA